jgi:AAA+ ATPase superfamily predicted ATPase
MKEIKNPFIDHAVVSKDDYCPREEVQNKIITKLGSGHNLVLIGDRRIGKTSTAHYVIDGMEKTHKVDIDLYHIREAVDIAEAIIDACKKVLDKVWDKKKFTDYASSIKPKLDMSGDGSLSFGIEGSEHKYSKTLNIAFNFLEEVVARSKGKVVVLFDELQAIKEVKDDEAILKYMRGRIQKLPRVPFMYVGSIRHEMDQIFRDHSSPFYKQAEVIYFDHIEEDSFYEFIAERFQRKKIVIERKVYNHLYKVCYGITADIQTFCRVAFDTLEKGSKLDFETFFYITEIIYKNEQKHFVATFERKGLTKIQGAFLIQLASFTNSKEANFFSKDFQNAIGVKSPGAVTNALNALLKKEFVYKSEDNYCLSNPFFKEWILDYKFVIQATAGVLSAGMPIFGTRLDFGHRERIIKSS